ncbi:hypothetical protein D3C71_1738750 [compost metagenome]
MIRDDDVRQRIAAAPFAPYDIHPPDRDQVNRLDPKPVQHRPGLSRRRTGQYLPAKCLKRFSAQRMRHSRHRAAAEIGASEQKIERMFG